MKRVLLLSTGLILASLQAGLAQSYETLRASYPDAIETTVRSEAAFIYAEPDVSSRYVGRYKQGKELLAYQRVGDFYAVAVPKEGHLGYMLLTDLAVPQEAGAAVAPLRSSRYRDPSAAQTMALIFPGGGHIYSGELVKGSALLGASLIGVVGGLMLSEDTRTFSCDDQLLNCGYSTDYSYLIGGSAVALAVWIYGILDAPRSARRANARMEPVAHIAPVSMRLGDRDHLGLSVRVQW